MKNKFKVQLSVESDGDIEFIKRYFKLNNFIKTIGGKVVYTDPDAVKVVEIEDWNKSI